MLQIYKGNVESGMGISKKVGYPTLNISFLSTLNCGVYRGNIIFNNENFLSTIFIDKSGNFLEAHLDNCPSIKIPNTVEFNLINELHLKNEKGIIPMYYSGCKSKQKNYIIFFLILFFVTVLYLIHFKKKLFR